MRQLIRPSLVQIMACRLDDTNPFIWTNVGILLIGPLGTNFSDIFIEIQKFSFRKMHLKMSSAKWRPFSLGLDVLTSWRPKRLFICFTAVCYESIFNTPKLHMTGYFRGKSTGYRWIPLKKDQGCRKRFPVMTLLSLSSYCLPMICTYDFIVVVASVCNIAFSISIILFRKQKYYGRTECRSHLKLF